jgi:hypothetical protein
VAEAQRVLGVSPGATADETKLAYFRLARQYHPDAVAAITEHEDGLKNNVDQQTATMRFAEVDMHRSCRCCCAQALLIADGHTRVCRVDLSWRTHTTSCSASPLRRWRQLLRRTTGQEILLSYCFGRLVARRQGWEVSCGSTRTAAA